VGIPSKIPRDRMGLHTMDCRARLMNGELSLENVPGAGTRLVCRVPRPATDRRSSQSEGESNL
jgi:signal transduction histidine kinase